jgi:hypothetical protein
VNSQFVKELKSFPILNKGPVLLMNLQFFIVTGPSKQSDNAKPLLILKLLNVQLSIIGLVLLEPMERET